MCYISPSTTFMYLFHCVQSNHSFVLRFYLFPLFVVYMESIRIHVNNNKVYTHSQRYCQCQWNRNANQNVCYDYKQGINAQMTFNIKKWKRKKNIGTKYIFYVRLAITFPYFSEPLFYISVSISLHAGFLCFTEQTLALHGFDELLNCMNCVPLFLFTN